MPYMLVPNRGGVVIATRFLVKGPDALLIASIASFIHSFIVLTNVVYLKCLSVDVSLEHFVNCLEKLVLNIRCSFPQT